MTKHKFITNQADIKELLKFKNVEEVLITTDIEAFDLLKKDEGSNSITDSFNWVEMVELNVENIIVENRNATEEIAYKDVTALCIVLESCPRTNDVELFINKNFSSTEIIY